MTSQNSGNKYSSLTSNIESLTSNTESEFLTTLKLYMWMDWTNINLCVNQNTRWSNSSHEIFKPIYWEFKPLHWVWCFYWWKHACWALPTPTGSFTTSSCLFHHFSLQFQTEVSPSTRYKHLALVSVVGFVQSKSKELAQNNSTREF